MPGGQDEVRGQEGHWADQVRALAETPGKTPDPNAGGCVDKVVGKFDGGVDPTKGCFEKLENKSPNDCITFNDTGSAEAAVDSCVAAFRRGHRPGADQRRRSAGPAEEVRVEST